MNRVAVTAIALAAMTATANAEFPLDPFGFAFGTAISNYDCKPIDKLPGNYDCKSLRPHPQFTTYYVMGTPKTGVCSISGMGYPALSDQAMPIAEDIAGQLSERFGIRFERSGTDNEGKLKSVNTPQYHGIEVSWINYHGVGHVSAHIHTTLFYACNDELKKMGTGAF